MRTHVVRPSSRFHKQFPMSYREAAVQYESVSEAVENLLALINKAKGSVPITTERMLDTTADAVLSMLEALETVWDVRTVE